LRSGFDYLTFWGFRVRFISSITADLLYTYAANAKLTQFIGAMFCGLDRSCFEVLYVAHGVV